jgi:hypothetical protein
MIGSMGITQGAHEDRLMHPEKGTYYAMFLCDVSCQHAEMIQLEEESPDQGYC